MSAHSEAILRRARPRSRRGFSSHPAQARALARVAGRDATGWLNPRAQDVVAIEPRASASRSGEAPAGRRTTARQIAQWRGRVRWARGAAVLRRYVVIALGLAVLGEVVARIVEPETHPLWPFAGVALALVGALAALAMPIKDATVAAMLDHGLGLFDTIGTALELESRATRNERSNASPRLTAHVVAEAQDALQSSFGAARARSRPGGREWGVVLALALVLGLLVALPSSGHTQSSRGGLAAQAGAGGGQVDHHGSRGTEGTRATRCAAAVGARVGHNALVSPLPVPRQEEPPRLCQQLLPPRRKSSVRRQTACEVGTLASSPRLRMSPVCLGQAAGQSASNEFQQRRERRRRERGHSASAHAGQTRPASPATGAPGGRAGGHAAGTPAGRGAAPSQSNHGSPSSRAPSGAAPPRRRERRRRARLGHVASRVRAEPHPRQFRPPAESRLCAERSAQTGPRWDLSDPQTAEADGRARWQLEAPEGRQRPFRRGDPAHAEHWRGRNTSRAEQLLRRHEPARARLLVIRR